MTADEVLGDLLDREGGWRDAVQRPDGSWDPATNSGITLPTLQAWHRRAAPGYVATEAELRRLTPEVARAIYQMVYIDEPGFMPANVPYEPLRVQLIDFGVNSGPERAVRWLQRVLRMDKVDGVLGPRTISELRTWHQKEGTLVLALVNDALVAARSYMIDRAVDTGAMRKADEEGVESRALGFFLARP